MLCHLHLESDNHSAINVVLCVNVVYISAGGVASPSLMPGQTGAARLIRNGDSSFEL